MGTRLAHAARDSSRGAPCRRAARCRGRRCPRRSAGPAWSCWPILAVAACLRLKGLSWGLPYAYQDPDEKVVLAGGLSHRPRPPQPRVLLLPVDALLPDRGGDLGGEQVLRSARRLADLARSPSSRTRRRTTSSAAPWWPPAAWPRSTSSTVSARRPSRGRSACWRRCFSRSSPCTCATRTWPSPTCRRPCSACSRCCCSCGRRACATPAPCCSAPWPPGLPPAPSTTSACSSCPARSPAGTSIATSRPAAPGAGLLAARALRRVAAPMLLAFVLSTPFAVLDPLHFLGDFYRQNQIVANGWLGFENVHNGYWYNLSVNLVGSLGRRAAGARPGRPRAGARQAHARRPHPRALRGRLLPLRELLARAHGPLPAAHRAAADRARRARLRGPRGRARRPSPRRGRGRRRGAAAGGDRAAGARLDQLLALAQRHRCAHRRQGLDRAPSAGQRGDRHGAVRSAARARASTCASTPTPA